ncbi:NAD-dependent epimerase/dehydratase family protein [candidate division KSB1 bacterium]|nr:NAD-dependent epimerase/dehydratase family protein [candidate division KSB1 bacterium]
MKVLFIGGTGKISSACTQAAIEAGIELWVLNRGQTDRPVPVGTQVLNGDIRDLQATKRLLQDHTFDAVVDWIAFTPEHIESDLELFDGRVGQFVFISSASVYQKPPVSLPIRESSPCGNPYWEYSRNKIACEERLQQAFRNSGFPLTIVRPSHTYDRTMLIVPGGATTLDRMRSGKPVVVHGDGTSLWTVTHHRDFARGFVPLLGLPQAIGETVHITSDEALTWNQIFDIVARAAGTSAKKCYVPSTIIARHDPEWGAGLMGDKAHSMIFDNSKIKQLAPGFVASLPFCRGVEEIIAWHDADASRRTIDPAFDQLCDHLAERYG